MSNQQAKAEPKHDTAKQMLSSAHKNTPRTAYAGGITVCTQPTDIDSIHAFKTLFRIGTQVELP